MNENDAPSTLDIRDREHLKLLVIFHIAVAVGVSLYAAHLLWDMHRFKSLSPRSSGFSGFEIFVAISTIFMSVPLLVSSHFMHHQQHRLFSLIVAGLACFLFPFGTVLGVLTIVVLTRDSVREAYR